MIRHGREDDLVWIARLLSESGEGAQWLPSGERFVIAEPEAGFLVWRITGPDEYEVLNLVVAPRYRRRGVARRLLAAVICSGKWFLEVRESNAAARSLYASTGFQEIGRRRDYYSNPREDAVQLVRGVPA